MSSNKKKLGLRGLYIAVLAMLVAVPAGISQLPPHPVPMPEQPVTTPINPVDAGHAANQARSFFDAPARSLAVSPPAPERPAYAAQPASLSQTLPAKRIIRDTVNKTLTVDGTEYPLRSYKMQATPNDPSASQWWVTNTQLNLAWDTPTGSNDTLLAVIDTGFALAHEEFSNRWHTNPGESGVAASENPSSLNCTARSLPLNASCNLIDEDANGIIDDESGAVSYQNPSRLNCTGQSRALAKDCNRIDDDGNGLVDDLTGWDFANNDNSVQAGELNPNGTGTTHGTETAGVAAATGNNAKGIAGVDWHTKVLPIQALDDDSYGDTLGVGRSIEYAIQQGADVISLSLGSTQPDSYVRAAVAEAIANGIAVVAASGNSPCNCIVYPANYPEVVAVGALDTNSLPASFSSYGTSLDILAPGTTITSPAWSAASPTAAYASNLAGTSFATPMVAGLMTRLLSSRPSMTPLQLIAAITESTNRLTLPSTASRTTTLGYGSMDASTATTRNATSKNSPFLYAFAPISRGNGLSPSSPADVVGNYGVKACEDGRPGTTPLFELTKAGASTIWSISQAEVWKAQASGYTATLFAEVCLQQPQDTSEAGHEINLFKEFRNNYTR